MNNNKLSKLFRLFRLFNIVALSLTIFSSNLTASNFSDLNNQEYILAPKCFIENNAFEYTELAVNKENQAHEMVLFNVNKNAWWKSLNKINHTQDCGKFINVTDDWADYSDTKPNSTLRITQLDYEYFLSNMLFNAKINSSKNLSNIKHSIRHGAVKEEILQGLFQKIDEERISDSLDQLSSHYNRVAYDDSGYKVATDINEWMEALANKYNKSKSEFSVEYISTNDYYKQPSVVAVLGADLPGDALIISSHMDTNGGGRRPGADDDGSGSMVVLETARLLAEANLELKRPVYFMWYAAEEMGLIGSKKVAREFQSRTVKIDSVLHFDTIGRRATANDPTLFLLRDNVDQSFTDYLSNLITTYLKLPVDYTTCGYACSDHASWTDRGYSSAAAFESSFSDINPYLHSSRDTREHVYMENLVNFTKLALTYVVDKNIGLEHESDDSDSQKNESPEDDTSVN